MDSWKQKVGIALHYCIEGRTLYLTAESFNPVANKEITSTISNLSQANISLALDLSLPLSVHEYITKSSANILSVQQYDDEVSLLIEFLADYEEVTGEEHNLSALGIITLLESTRHSLIFAEDRFDPSRLNVPPCSVSRAAISSFISTQATLNSGIMLRDLGYTPDISFASTDRSRFSPEYYSPRRGIGQYKGY